MIKKTRLSIASYCYVALLGVINVPNSEADWTKTFDNSTYYTSDVALFSVTRRLSLKNDPTQPVVDRPKQGGDFVYEPDAKLKWSGNNNWGKVTGSVKASGYIFANQAAYNHAMIETHLTQTFSTDTHINIRYNLIPNLYIGQNSFRVPDVQSYDQSEIVTSHYWSMQVDQPFTDKITGTVYSRYGLRNYNAPFQYRDTKFWTLGPRFKWFLSPKAEMLVGYHYEVGNANSQQNLYARDNISYVSNYASTEFTVHWLTDFSSTFILDYEKNNYTTNKSSDMQYGTSESVYQGEATFLYQLNQLLSFKLGWQYGNRKLTTDSQSISINNVWLGLQSAF